MKEQWKIIRGYDGIYQISNFGRFKSHRNGRWGYLSEGKILRGANAPDGYNYIRLFKNSNHEVKMTHRVVAEHFIDNPDNKPHVNHIDGNKLNNFIGNLEWVTKSEDLKHAYRTGLKGSKFTKLKRGEVLQIRSLVEAGEKQKDVAKRFNTSPQNVCNIMKRKSWKYI